MKIFLFSCALLAGMMGKFMAEDVVVAEGKTVSFDYTLTVERKVVDSSQGKKPLEYVQGKGQIIPGLEKQLAGLKVGDEKTVDVKPEEGYGMYDASGVKEVEKNLIPSDIPLTVGTLLEMQDPSGHVFPAKVTEIKDKTVMLDFNHPWAGKELSFQIKIVDVK